MTRRIKSVQRHTTHYVPDWHTKSNLKRLKHLDRLATLTLGGILPEQANPALFQRVLDLGSGTGHWAIDVALMYPTTSLVGIDIDPYLSNYAQEEAEAAGVGERVKFFTMDALQTLAFPDASFDLVNLRFGTSFLRTWDWPRILQECTRVLRSEGTMRITEMEVCHQSSSAALLQTNRWLTEALTFAGYFFEPVSTGLTARLADLLRSQGYQQIQTKMITPFIQGDTKLGQEMYNYLLTSLVLHRSLIRKWCNIDLNEYDRTCQQVYVDAQQSNFYAQPLYRTVWGINGRVFAE